VKLHTAINFVCLLIIAALIALAVHINYRETLVEDGQIQLSGLHSPVQIYFDKPAVPYIQARSQEDLVFAQGFVTASERLFQMDMLRRVARGQMAEIFGGSSLANDRLARIIGFKRLAESEYSVLSLPTKQWLRAYCKGVNAYISQRGSKTLPLEFIMLGYKPRAWQPEDTLAILKYLQYASDECWQLDVLQNSIKEKGGIQLARQMFGQWPQPRQLISNSSGMSCAEIAKLPDLNRLTRVLPPPAELAWGSNGWVISNKLSRSGGCLLACDKHTMLTFPDLFFLCSLRCPLVHVAGLTIPGVPGILIGRNEHIAWAPVSLKGRWQDLYYTGSQEWAKAKEFEEEISQRFASNVIEKVLVTRHGPLLVRADDTGAALNWYGFNVGNNIIESIWDLNNAKNFVEFQSALQKYKGSPQTFLYTDTAGNIGNQIAGYQAKQLSLATADSADGHADENQLGYIVANAQSSEVSAKLSSFGVLSNNWAAIRAGSFLKAHQQSGQKLRLEDMITLQSDVKAPLSELAIKSLRTALQNTRSIDQYQKQAFAMLSDWDGQLKDNSFCACFYESFLTELTKQALKEKIGLSLTCDYINKWPRWSEFTRQLFEKQPGQFLPLAQHDFSSFLVGCFSQSLQNLRLAFHMQQMPGILPGCQWKYMHKADIWANLAKFIPPAIVNIINPLLPAAIGLGGDQDCVNACNYFLTNKSFQYNCNSGPTARLIIDMADNDKFYQALTFGQCAHLFSGDRINQTNNQLDLWRNMKFHAVAFSDKELDILAGHHLTLVSDNQ